MAEAAPNLQQHEDFWKPLPNSRLHSVGGSESPVSCSHCHGELVAGARFCHLCGVEQAAEPVRPQLVPRLEAHSSPFPAWGLSVASFVALVLGCVCLVAAVITGFLYKATTLSDWQAIQLWRIEWLLGALALFTAGNLLKRPLQPKF